MTDLVTATITRLGELKPTTLTQVAGLLALNSLVRPPIDKMPAAYVLPGDRRYGLVNGLVNAVRQLGSQAVTIILLVGSRSPVGDDVFNPIGDLESAVIGKLLGWQPDAEFGPLLYAAGRLIDVQSLFFTYQMTFSRDHTVRA